MSVQLKKRILRYVLRFVGGKAQTNQISKQRLAKFLKQFRRLRWAG